MPKKSKKSKNTSAAKTSNALSQKTTGRKPYSKKSKSQTPAATAAANNDKVDGDEVPIALQVPTTVPLESSADQPQQLVEQQQTTVTAPKPKRIYKTKKRMQAMLEQQLLEQLAAPNEEIEINEDQLVNNPYDLENGFSEENRLPKTSDLDQLLNGRSFNENCGLIAEFNTQWNELENNKTKQQQKRRGRPTKRESLQNAFEKLKQNENVVVKPTAADADAVETEMAAVSHEEDAGAAADAEAEKMVNFLKWEDINKRGRGRPEGSRDVEEMGNFLF